MSTTPVSETNEPPRIAGPVAHSRRPSEMPIAEAWDTHAHIFGPVDRFPFAPGRGYTPPEAPVEQFIALHEHLGITRGVIVQGNAHGLDNAVVLDALKRFPNRFRGVAITDTRIPASMLREWHKLGMRGLRFHLFPPGGKPTMVRGVGLDVFEVFRPTMRELGWIMQTWCDHRVLPEVEGLLREVAREMPVVLDHILHMPAERGTGDPGFQTLLHLVGEGIVYVKLSAPYRLSQRYPDYEDAEPLHTALLRANPERLLWGTDWPHPQIAAELMPDDGQLVDLFHRWTPKIEDRRRILVETPVRLFDRA
jgi:predicted TIM-barrel fold metal-dependent hydrolase